MKSTGVVKAGAERLASLYVTDRPNNRIQGFQKAGTYIKETVLAPAHLRSRLDWEVVFDSLDTERRFLYVQDGTNNKVWVLNRETLEPVYSSGRGGEQPWQFDWLHNLAVDSQGNIYFAGSSRD